MISPTKTSPTKPRDHTSRLLAQIAELSAQRDQLITDMLPLIPAHVLSSASASKSSDVASGSDDAGPAAKQSAESNTAAPADGAATATAPSTAFPKPTSAPAPLTESTRAAVLAHADHTVKQHIGLLHAYNGIRDIGQNVMGLLAEQRGVRVVQVMEECGVGEGD